MNTILELTARSRAHQVRRDDKVLAYARALNSNEATPKKAARTVRLKTSEGTRRIL